MALNPVDDRGIPNLCRISRYWSTRSVMFLAENGYMVNKATVSLKIYLMEVHKLQFRPSDKGIQWKPSILTPQTDLFTFSVLDSILGAILPCLTSFLIFRYDFENTGK